MRYHDINRTVAWITGESIETIEQRGFNLVGQRVHDPEAFIVDWDAVDDQHESLSTYPLHWLQDYRS